MAPFSTVRSCIVRAIAVVVLSALAAACDHSSTTVSSPTGTKCEVTVTNSLAAVPPSGASGTLTVTTTRDCAWAASSEAPWLTFTTSSSGQGSGSTTYLAAANTEAAARQGKVSVNDTQVMVSQEAACAFAVTPATITVGVGGGTQSVSVETGASCEWTTASQADWIQVTSGATGARSVTVSVAANQGGSRSGRVVIAGRTISVEQAGASGAPCSYGLAPATQAVPAAGGTGSVTITTADGCAWTATPTATPWLSVTAPASGTGSGSVGFSAQANTGAARSGTLTIGAQTVTVTQPAPSPGCTFSLSAANQAVPAAGGTGSVTLTTAATCAWTVVSSASWLTFTGAASRTGPGAVSFSAAANTGAARSATLTLGGQTFTVDQAAAPAPACTFSLSAANQAVPAAGGTGSVTLTTAATCAWTVASSASWLTFSGGASRTGPGMVNFSAAANTGAARSATLTIGGQTFTVNQAAAPAPACTFSLSAANQAVPAAGGTGSVTLTTAATCTWMVTSSAPWLTFSGGASRTGPGMVNFSAAANTGAARSATLTIGGQTFTVNQAAAPPPACTFSLSAANQAVPAAGGTGSVTLTTAATCTWMVTSSAPWLTFSGGASRTGPGMVNFSAMANPGAARSATLTIGGQTFTVTQAAAPPACTYTLNPTSGTFSLLGGPGSFTVSTASNCAWTATTTDDWITITAGASGTGNGTVTFTVAVRVGAARNGSIRVANQTFAVMQRVLP